MAYNDMHVIIFKILAYVYDCMKRGKAVDTNLIMAEQLGIPEAYWAQIVRQLVSHGYITGIQLSETKMGLRVSCDDPMVTLEGVQYLIENSMMHKAAKFVSEGSGVLATIASTILSII